MSVTPEQAACDGWNRPSAVSPTEDTWAIPVQKNDGPPPGWWFPTVQKNDGPPPGWWFPTGIAPRHLPKNIASPIVPRGCVQPSQNPLKGLTKNQKIIGAVIAGVVGVVLLLAPILGVATNSHSDGHYACVKTNSAEFNSQGDPDIQDSLESYCAQLEDIGALG